jgi:RimJ/RimL family protein N-acetyltransferase
VARGYPLLLGDGCRLRRASADDVDFLAALASAAEVEPFLAARSARTREELLEQVLLAEETPQEAGRFVLEVPEGDGWQRAGALAFEVSNRRSRIVWLHAVMVEPAFRGRGLAEHAVRALVRHLIARPRIPPRSARGLRLQRAGGSTLRTRRLRARGS